MLSKMEYLYVQFNKKYFLYILQLICHMCFELQNYPVDFSLQKPLIN